MFFFHLNYLQICWDVFLNLTAEISIRVNGIVGGENRNLYIYLGVESFKKRIEKCPASISETFQGGIHQFYPKFYMFWSKSR
jgi:hypothetical protein